MSHIRVHELASELEVSTQQVISYLEELGKKVRGPSTVLGVSAAAKIRGRFRPARSTVRTAPEQLPQQDHPEVEHHGTGNGRTVDDGAREGAVAPAGSLFLPPVAPRRAPAPDTPAALAAQRVFANPFAVPGDTVPRPRTAPIPTVSPARAVANRVPSAPAAPVIVPPEPDVDTLWRDRGFDAGDQETWCGAGLKPSESAIADRCRSAGIVATELGVKLSGRTALQRLRDGEASTSVWARIREAEQQPRRAGTKLTGRFQLS